MLLSKNHIHINSLNDDNDPFQLYMKSVYRENLGDSYLERLFIASVLTYINNFKCYHYLLLMNINKTFLYGMQQVCSQEKIEENWQASLLSQRLQKVYGEIIRNTI